MAINRHREEEALPLRVRRVAEALKEEASLTITQRLSDPRLGFVTVTSAKVSRDLREAVIYVSIMGSRGDRSKTLHALRDATGFIKQACADRLKLRFTPNIRFEFDPGIDKSIRVAELLRQAAEEPPGPKLEADPSENPEEPMEPAEPEKG